MLDGCYVKGEMNLSMGTESVPRLHWLRWTGWTTVCVALQVQHATPVQARGAKNNGMEIGSNPMRRFVCFRWRKMVGKKTKELSGYVPHAPRGSRRPWKEAAPLHSPSVGLV